MAPRRAEGCAACLHLGQAWLLLNGVLLFNGVCVAEEVVGGWFTIPQLGFQETRGPRGTWKHEGMEAARTWRCEGMEAEKTCRHEGMKAARIFWVDLCIPTMLGFWIWDIGYFGKWDIL